MFTVNLHILLNSCNWLMSRWHFVDIYDFRLFRDEKFIWVLCRSVSTEIEWAWEKYFKFHHNWTLQSTWKLGERTQEKIGRKRYVIREEVIVALRFHRQSTFVLLVNVDWSWHRKVFWSGLFIACSRERMLPFIVFGINFDINIGRA
jgi:hypothetical protein